VHAIYFYQRENFLIQAEETDEDTNEKEYVMRWGK
jgi:putative acetyltransferase